MNKPTPITEGYALYLGTLNEDELANVVKDFSQEEKSQIFNIIHYSGEKFEVHSSAPAPEPFRYLLLTRKIKNWNTAVLFCPRFFFMFRFDPFKINGRLAQIRCAFFGIQVTMVDYNILLEEKSKAMK